jgi:hypothetical protein
MGFPGNWAGLAAELMRWNLAEVFPELGDIRSCEQFPRQASSKPGASARKIQVALPTISGVDPNNVIAHDAESDPFGEGPSLSDLAIQL